MNFWILIFCPYKWHLSVSFHLIFRKPLEKPWSSTFSEVSLNVTLRYVAFYPSDHYETCFISIIWNRPILQLAVFGSLWLAVSGCVPAASISSLSWWSTVALFLWSYTVYCWIFYVDTGSQSPFSAVFYENCLVFSGHPLTQTRFSSCITVHFSLASRTAGFWL